MYVHSFYFSSIDAVPIGGLNYFWFLDYHSKKFGTIMNFLLISIKDISFYLSVQHATVSYFGSTKGILSTAFACNLYWGIAFGLLAIQFNSHNLLAIKHFQHTILLQYHHFLFPTILRYYSIYR